MSRFIKQGVVRDGRGNVIDGATVSVFLTGTETPAQIYEEFDSASHVNHVMSDEWGGFKFYVDDVDYDRTQLFTIVLSRQNADDVAWERIPIMQADVQDVGSNINALSYGVDLNDTTIRAAISAIGADNRTLVIPAGTWIISDDLTIPSNIGLKVEQGGMLQIKAGIKLTVTGLDAGLYQVFDCIDGAGVHMGEAGYDPTTSGWVRFGANLKEAFPEWWGVADVGLAVNAAFNAMVNRGSVRLTSNQYYLYTTIKTPLESQSLKLYSTNGSIINVPGNGDCIDLTSTNENYGRHIVEGLNLRGPNSYYTGSFVSEGCGIRMQKDYEDLSGGCIAYNTVIRDCNVAHFKYGLRMRGAIGTIVEGKAYFRFNEYGVYIDGGATNANSFFGTFMRENAIAGLYSTGIASPPSPTSNIFYSCCFESNVTRSSPVVANGIGVYLKSSYNYSFYGCYFENQEYSIILDHGSSHNKFYNTYSSTGGYGDSMIKLTGLYVNNNSFIGFHNVSSGENAGFITADSDTQRGNVFRDCYGLNFSNAAISTDLYVDNCVARADLAYESTGIAKITMPPHGYRSNVGSGTTPGKIDGMGTTTATLYTGGYGEILVGTGLTEDTTIVAFNGLTKHSIFVLWSYQNNKALTIKHGGSTGQIVLKPTINPSISVDSTTHEGTLTTIADAVMNNYGQMIVFYVNGLRKAYEIGRNF